MRATEFIAEYRNTDDPALRKWFAGSKVVDKDRKPLIVYHGTLFNDEIKSFHDLSHFGTQGAANARIEDLLNLHPSARGYNQPSPGEEKPHIYPVYLKIVNPIQLPDLAEWHWSDMWMELIKTHEDEIGKLLKDDYGDEYESTWDMLDALQTYDENPWEFLKSLGHDGVYYVNAHEDKGKISWIPFSGKQVMSAFG